MFLTIVMSVIALTIINVSQFIISGGQKKYLILWLIGIFITGGLIYIALPPLQLANIIGINGFWLFIGTMQFAISTYSGHQKPKHHHLGLTIVGGLTVLALILKIGIHINTNLHVKESYNTIDIKNVKSHVAPTLKRNETPVAIAPATIFNKISKDMSDVPNSNAFVIAENPDTNHHEIQAQYYKGQPVYIVPIQFRGVAKYYNNHGIIPGYFRISATDPNAEPVFVHKSIYYSNHQYFSHNVNRVIYTYNPLLADVGDTAQLEIDNNGTPYYVKTLYQPDMLSNRINYQQLKVAVVNAETGQIKFYKPTDSPKFINENLTSDAAADMNNDFGRNIHGWLNRMIGQKDIKIPTENGPEDGVTTVFDNNGTISYLSDFTSTASSTNSALGYSMINARTGKLSYYTTKGIMDTDGAIDNADRNYHAQNFHAEMPVLYDIDGHATWVMSILDSSGLQRGFYYVDGANPSIHANGNTINTTLDEFRQMLVNTNSSIKNSSSNKVIHHKGIVNRSFVADNNTALFTIDHQKTIYQINTADYKSANLIRPGDKISFTTGGNGTKNTVTNFIDTSLTTQNNQKN